MEANFILKKIHIDPYPVDLWICMSEDLSPILDKFNDYKHDRPYRIDDLGRTCNGFTDSIIDLETRNFGILIWFKNIDTVNSGFLAHESNHAVKRIWKFIGERHVGREAESYLLEYIVNKIEETKKEYYGNEN